MFAMHPQQLARRGIQSYDCPARSGGGINHAVGHERRSLEVEFRTRAQVVRFESPGDLELAEIGAGDLVERRVVCVPEISAVGAPLAVLRTRLRAEIGDARKPTYRQDQTS